MISNETGLPDTFNLETRKNVKWSVSIGNNAYATPVISKGKVLIGANSGTNAIVEGEAGVFYSV